jgi:hypothetical protein
MRKYIRNIIRQEAKREKAKPSRWLKIAFDTRQNKKYGVNKRKANRAKGTHKKNIWRSRVAMFASR